MTVRSWLAARRRARAARRSQTHIRTVNRRRHATRRAMLEHQAVLRAEQHEAIRATLAEHRQLLDEIHGYVRHIPRPPEPPTAWRR